MKKIGLMTDSHSGIKKEEADAFGIYVLSMPFYIEGHTYYEGMDLTKERFYETLRKGAEVSTSQPSPQDVMDMWDEMLKTYDQILYLPISSGLSGSYMTASAMAGEEPYEGKVFVVDCGRVSATLHRAVLDAKEMIDEGYEAQQICKILEESRADMIMYVALSTLKYLKKGGRVKPGAAMVADALNIKPVMQFGVETLDVYQKTRGMKKAKKTMIEAMKEEFSHLSQKDCYLLAATSAEEKEAKEWVQEIEEAFPGMEVFYDDLTLGLCCHIGPDGFGIGYACKPRK